MELDGIRTIYKEEVAYWAGPGVVPVALDPQAMAEFCSPDDAKQIFELAKQVLSPQAKLVGGTSEFTVTLGQGGVLVPGPDQVHADAGAGGRYEYGTTDGYRPFRIQSPADKIDQYVSGLVGSHKGQTGLIIADTGQGRQLQWA